MMKIVLDIGDAIKVAVALSAYAYDAVEVAEKFPHSKPLVEAAENKFALMNRYREAADLRVLTVDELRKKFSL